MYGAWVWVQRRDVTDLRIGRATAATGRATCRWRLPPLRPVFGTNNPLTPVATIPGLSGAIPGQACKPALHRLSVRSCSVTTGRPVRPFGRILPGPLATEQERTLSGSLVAESSGTRHRRESARTVPDATEIG